MASPDATTLLHALNYALGALDTMGWNAATSGDRDAAAHAARTIIETLNATMPGGGEGDRGQDPDEAPEGESGS